MATKKQIARRKAVLAWAEANPRQFSNAYWSDKGRDGASTTYCLAGVTVLAAGWTLDYWDGRFAASVVSKGEKKKKSIEKVAVKLLGLESDGVSFEGGASRLFYKSDREALAMLRVLAAEKPVKS